MMSIQVVCVPSESTRVGRAAGRSHDPCLLKSRTPTTRSFVDELIERTVNTKSSL